MPKLAPKQNIAMKKLTRCSYKIMYTDLLYEARLTQAGLTPMNWVGAPPEVMEETLLYIKKRFGSVEDYLVHCGFGKRRMDELRQAMSAKG